MNLTGESLLDGDAVAGSGAPPVWCQSLREAARRLREEEWVVLEIESAARRADLSPTDPLASLARVADLLRRIGRTRLALEMELVAARRWHCFRRPAAEAPDRVILRRIELNLASWEPPLGNTLVELAWMPSLAQWVARAFCGFAAYLWLLRVHPGVCPEVWEAWSSPGSRMAVPVYGLDERVSACCLGPTRRRRLRDEVQVWIESAVTRSAREQFGPYGALFSPEFAVVPRRRDRAGDRRPRALPCGCA